MKQVNSFIVLILHFGFHALILYVLKLVHLKLVGFLRQLSSHVARCLVELLGYHLVFLSLLASGNELHVWFVEYNLLDVAGVGLAHEKRLRVAFFVVLNYFVSET